MAKSDDGSPRALTEDDAVVFENVLVTRRSDVGWHCVIDGRAVFVGHHELAQGCTMPQEQHHGRVVLTARAARNLNLRARHAEVGRRQRRRDSVFR